VHTLHSCKDLHFHLPLGFLDFLFRQVRQIRQAMVFLNLAVFCFVWVVQADHQTGNRFHRTDFLDLHRLGFDVHMKKVPVCLGVVQDPPVGCNSQMNKAVGRVVQELLEVEFVVFDKAMEAYQVDKEKEVEDIDRVVALAGSEVDQVDRVKAVVLADSEVNLVGKVKVVVLADSEANHVDRVKVVVLADSEVDHVDRVKAVVLADSEVNLVGRVNVVVLADSEVDHVDRVKAVVLAGSEVNLVGKVKVVIVYKEDQVRKIVVEVLGRTLEEGGMILVVEQVFGSEGAVDFPVVVHHLASC
jgi:hypothetical protein